eukprot:763658-Hanusia_phi.AAC.10
MIEVAKSQPTSPLLAHPHLPAQASASSDPLRYRPAAARLQQSCLLHPPTQVVEVAMGEGEEGEDLLPAVKGATRVVEEAVEPPANGRRVIASSCGPAQQGQHAL